MPYTITREDAERDLNALRSVLSGLYGFHVSSSSAPALQELADLIEEQLRPAVQEPEAFGSLIRAKSPQEHDQASPDLWQLSPVHGRHYWMSQSGVLEVWSELTDVEVLRVGLGSDDLDDAFKRGQTEGERYMSGRIHGRLGLMLAEAITSERKNALEKAIQAVEELAP